MNLLEILKGYLTPALVAQAATFVEEDKKSTEKALKGILPTILGGLTAKVSEQNGTEQLMSMLKTGGYDGRELTNIGMALADSKSSEGLLKAGTGVISSLFGSNTEKIASVIASESGVASSSATSLMNLVAPLVMGLIGKEASAKKGLNTTDLTSLLTAQKAGILAALPAGVRAILGSSLGLGNLAGTTTKSNEINAGMLPKWLIPALIGLTMAGFALYMTKGCATKAKEEAMTTIDSVSIGAIKTVDSTTTVVSSAVETVEKMLTLKLPNGSEIEVPQGSLEDQIITFIKDKNKVVDKAAWFNFDRLLFDTGKSTLKPASVGQVEKTIAILNAFPTVKIKIGGYTDNQGNASANMKLSSERAKVVMNALTKGGISESRIEAEGYGDQHPVASNDTEEGRSQNRRIAVLVTAK